MATTRTILLAVLVSVAAVGFVHSATAQVSVRLPDTSTTVSNSVQIPIRTGELSGQNVLSYEFTVEYEEPVLDVTGVETEGTLSEGRTVIANTDSTGQITVSMGGTTPLDGEGVLLYLTVAPDASGSTPLSWASFQFNEGTPAANVQDGSITVGEPESINVSFPDTSGAVGETVLVPIETDSTGGVGITSYSFSTSYDPDVVGVTGVRTSGTISEGYSVELDTSESGSISVAAAGTEPLSGAGTLLYLEVQGEAEGTSPLNWTEFSFNEGTPPATTVSGSFAAESPGPVLVSLPDTSGTVGEAMQVPVYVEDVTGAGIQSYSFEVQYNSLLMEVTGVSAEGTLSEGYSVQVDTSGSGAVSVAAAGSDTLSGAGTLLYLTVEPKTIGTAELIWEQMQFNEGIPSVETQDGSLQVEPPPTEAVEVHLPDTSGAVGEQLEIPVVVGDVTGKGIQAYSFEMQYDSSLVEVTGASAEGTLSEGYSVQVDTSGSGTVTVAAAGSGTLSGAGALLHLTVKPKTAGTAELIWGQLQFNEGTPPADTQNGSLEVVPVPSVQVSLPDTTEEVGQEVELPVRVSDVSGDEILSYSFTAAFEPQVLELTGVSLEGTLSEGYSVEVDTSSSGALSVAAAGTNAIGRAGTLLNLVARLKSTGTSLIEWESFTLNEGEFEVNLQPGQVEVISPEALPPDPPVVLGATSDSGKVTITWNSNPESDLESYLIYRDTAPLDSVAGPPSYAALDSLAAGDTTFVDTGVQSDVTYYYRVTAVDSMSNESGFSREVQATPDFPTISFADGREGQPYEPPSPTPGTENNPVGRFGLTADMNGAVLASLTTAHHGSSLRGISSVEVWRSTDSTFAVDEDNLLASDTSATPAVFEELSLSISQDTTYVFLVVDLTEGAGGDYAPVIRDENALSLENGGLGYVNGEPSSTFTDAYLSSGATPLPVELVSFDATIREEKIQLSWQTASESGNARFEVQRKAEGKSRWTTVGSVQGSGTTSEARSYQFTDENLPYEADRLTYRLRQVDIDGSASVLKTVRVDRGLTGVELLGTYPNPVSQQATVRYALPKRRTPSSQRGQVTIRLYDVLGREVRTLVQWARQGRHKATVDVSGLPSGTYFLRLRVEDGLAKTRKLTVTR